MKTRLQSGFTMVEMLVAMTLGLMLMVVLGQVFVSSKEAYRTTEDLSRLQEDARFAVIQLGRVIRMTSFTTDPNAVRTTVFPVATAPALTGTNGTGTNADSITVRYQGSGSPLADGTVMDCQGNVIKGGDMSVARFYLATGANGGSALFCDNTGTVGATNGTIELAAGVENMQVLYGEDTNADGAADRYVLPTVAGFQFDRVVSVRVAFLVRSTNEVATATNTNTYPLLDVTYNPVDDRRLRRVYLTTITLRNRAP